MSTTYERYKDPDVWPLLIEDKGKFEEWLVVERVTAAVFEKHELIPVGLWEALARIEITDDVIRRIQDREETTGHDLQSFLDVTREILIAMGCGDLAPYLHLGLTSYDTEDTATARLLKRVLDILISRHQRLADIVLKQAALYKETLQIGRTHGMHAEPITFAFKLLIWYDKVDYLIKELRRLKGVVGVGKISGVVGVYTIEPSLEKEICEQLGLKAAKISTQILPRRIHATYAFTLILAAQEFACIAEEIRNLQRPEIAEVQEAFRKGQVGSSAMKHKRNPVRCENVSSLGKHLRGEIQAFLANIITWGERDLSNSAAERLALGEISNLLGFMILRMQGVIDGLVVNPERMIENLNLSHGVVYSQNVLLQLRGKGMEAAVAERLIQELSFEAIDTKTSFKELLLANEAISGYLSAEEVEASFDPWKNNLRYIGEIYARFGL